MKLNQVFLIFWSLGLLALASGCGKPPGPNGEFNSTAMLLPMLPQPEEPRDDSTNTPASDCRDYSELYTRRFAAASSLQDVHDQIVAELGTLAPEVLIEVPANWGPSDGKTWQSLGASDLPAFKKLAATFSAGWKRYSAGWIAHSGVKKIIFVTGIHVAGKPRSARPDIGNQAVWYDAGLLNHCSDSDEEIIHHEFYHVVEAAHFGDYYYKDPKWAALNPQGFVYGTGGSAAYTDPHYVAKDHPQAGFVTTYSTYGLEEDKAEVYAWTQVPRHSAKVDLWSKDDTYLAAKRDAMKAFVATESALR